MPATFLPRVVIVMFAAALMLAAGLLVLAGRYLNMQDPSCGWATLLGSCLQMGAVYFAARMGFRAQDRQNELTHQTTIKALVAPIKAELVHDYEYLAETVLSNRATLDAIRAGSAGDVPCTVTRYVELGSEIFDAHRARLGELGSFLAYVITRTYLFLKAASREERVTLPAGQASAVIEETLLAQNARLKSMGYLIDLLQAVEETGSTDEAALREKVAGRQSAFAGGVALEF